MEYILEMKNMRKDYNNITVLNNVTLNLRQGEVMCLVGENGAGKSTLIKLLSGSLAPTAGEIFINGIKQEFSSPYDALQKGISVIYQELNYYPDLTIGENLFAGRLPLTKYIKKVDWARVYNESSQALGELGMNISPKHLVSSLTVAQKQFIEIAKAISRENIIVVMDEPTASLNDNEVENLFEQIKNLKRRGISVIYISHRLEEVFKIADTIKVLRDGYDVGTLNASDATKEEIIRLMVGREIKGIYSKKAIISGKKVIEIGHMKNSVLKDINIYARSGEVVSIFGLMGNGAQELLESIFGVRKNDSAEILLNGKRVDIKSPRDAIELGIAYIPPERKVDGLILEHTIRQNIVTPSIKEYSKKLYMDKRKETRDTMELITQLKIRAQGTETVLSSLSGGNQQKVLIGKWIRKKPHIMLVCEPTRGVDIATKLQLYTIIEKLCEEGVTIIMVSPELPEILGLSDRVYVIKDGRITGEFSRNDMSQESIMNCAIE